MVFSAVSLFVIGSFGYLSEAKDFTGTYEGTTDGSKTTVKLTQTGDKLVGSAEQGGLTLVIDGIVAGDDASGTVKVSSVTLFFRATLDGSTLVMKLSETKSMDEAETLRFERVGKGSSEATTALAFSKEPSEILKSGKQYTHASGGKFRYPANWQVKEGEGYVQLIPPDAKEGELIIMKADSAGGATDPSSPEILSYLDSQIAESVPDARREGKPEKAVAGSGKGVILNWNGTIEGRKSLIRGYVAIVKSYGVALVAIGPKDVVESRDKDLRMVFQSLGWGQGKVDQRIVGTWNYWGYKGSSDGKYGREEKATCVLNADGTFSYSNSAETSISAQGTDQGGNQTWVGGMNSRRGNGWGGTWTADGSTIILNFEDGSSETFTYRFEQQGQNTFLVTEGDNKKSKMEWSRG